MLRDETCVFYSVDCRFRLASGGASSHATGMYEPNPKPREPVAPPMPREALVGVERYVVPLLERINRSVGLKRALHAIIGRADSWFIAFITGRLWRVRHLERLTGLDAAHGVILVSNHRSFFDMYLCMSMIHMRTGRVKRAFFPVRSGFFYDRWLGALLNLAISGGSMWPPVFREEERRGLNRIGLEQLAAVLGPGAFVGIHPEGRRGTGDDPYTLLPARNGVGRLVEACHPETVVLPYFILGLSNSFRREVTRNFRRRGRQGEPVRIRFGHPMRVAALREAGDANAITAQVMARIVELGAEDRAEGIAGNHDA